MILVANRIDGRPKPVMLKSRQLLFVRQAFERIAFPDGLIVLKIIKDPRLAQKESTIAPTPVTFRLLFEVLYAIIDDFQGAESGRGLHSCNRCKRPLLPVKVEQP